MGSELMKVLRTAMGLHASLHVHLHVHNGKQGDWTSQDARQLTSFSHCEGALRSNFDSGPEKEGVVRGVTGGYNKACICY